MKKQNDLQWFLIKKFIEILAVVGVVEYLLTFLVNRFVLPNVLLYFFPGVEENPLLLGSGVIFFLSAVLMLLILGALNAMFPSPLHEMVQAALEQMQKNFMHTVSAGKTNFSFYELNRGQAILLFLVAFVVVLVILTPYVLGAVCFAKITIKEFRQIQREREEEQKEFDRKRNLMLSDIAHDLRTPMTTVNGYAKALADGMVVEPEKQLEYLQAIQNKSARMNDLIHLLFEYVKLDSEGFSLDRKETDLSELLRENAALIYADFEDAGMEFEIDIPEEVVSVSVDSIQFSRVITNLLNNAIEACEKCSGKKFMKMKLVKEKDNIIISVKNTYDGKLNIKDGEIQTSKKYEIDEHGVGIKNIIEVITKYQGSYAIRNDNNEFYFSVILPN